MHRFIHQMVLRNTVNAALQRAYVYDDGADANLKSEFKRVAKEWLKEFGERYQRIDVTERQWCAEIQSLAHILNQEFGPYLRGGGIRIGICQKMISLYLKYLWLITGNENKKPLFAVIDRGIMTAAHVPNAPNWTHLNTEPEYLRVVHIVDSYARDAHNIDGAQWEAGEWQAVDEED